MRLGCLCRHGILCHYPQHKKLKFRKFTTHEYGAIVQQRSRVCIMDILAKDYTDNEIQCLQNAPSEEPSLPHSSVENKIER